MIKNWRAAGVAVLAVGLAAGCREREADPDTFQGVVEYEERDLGFEVTGRGTEIGVHEGARLLAQWHGERVPGRCWPCAPGADRARGARAGPERAGRARERVARRLGAAGAA